MSLSQLYLQKILSNSSQTDKGTAHSYINGYYNAAFSGLEDKEINLLEIGVLQGQSLSLWREYFSKANIYGIDPSPESLSFCKDLKNITFHNIDAYCQKTLDMFEDNFFDFIIDDGPHTLESQIFSAKEWTRKLKIGGKLVIEDIAYIQYVNALNNAIPSNFDLILFDMRKDKGRFDDVILECTRTS